MTIPPISISQDILNRKGASSRAKIPGDVLDLLTQGYIETKSLVEWLAIDLNKLCVSVFNQDPEIDPKLGIMQRMRDTAKHLHQSIDDLRTYAQHPSDTIRSLVCLSYIYQDLHLEDRLKIANEFGCDSSMMTREVACLSIRHPFVSDDFETALPLLLDYTVKPHEGSRRFVIEGTRPHGVWTPHFETLKQNPERGRRLLEAVKADPSRYVQNAAANWINDAAKNDAQWVRNLCESWQTEARSPATDYIIKRGLRSLS